MHAIVIKRSTGKAISLFNSEIGKKTFSLYAGLDPDQKQGNTTSGWFFPLGERIQHGTFSLGLTEF